MKCGRVVAVMTGNFEYWACPMRSVLRPRRRPARFEDGEI